MSKFKNFTSVLLRSALFLLEGVFALLQGCGVILGGAARGLEWLCDQFDDRLPVLRQWCGAGKPRRVGVEHYGEEDVIRMDAAKADKAVNG